MNAILNGEKLKAFSLRSETRQGCHFYSTKRNKRYPKWKGKSKLSLFADDIIQYKENSKDSTKKLSELINEYSTFAGYKVNIQKSVSFLYTNNNLPKRGIKKREFFKNEDCLRPLGQ